MLSSACLGPAGEYFMRGMKRSDKKRAGLKGNGVERQWARFPVFQIGRLFHAIYLLKDVLARFQNVSIILEEATRWTRHHQEIFLLTRNSLRSPVGGENGRSDLSFVAWPQSKAKEQLGLGGTNEVQTDFRNAQSDGGIRRK